MATSGRSADRRALLARADADLAKVEAQYNASLHAKAIGAELRIDIKNLMENLRSILEYVAEDIRDTHCPTAKTPKPVYFPILPDRPQFEARMQQWYPNLNSTKKTLWDYLEFVQP
ncbi:MAG: hypothetical protein NTU91_16350 [Chloroflexi bacterium]|nr:hypothetical protein [Chloroflexota bacterium]